jgi:hypothetical protein
MQEANTMANISITTMEAIADILVTNNLDSLFNTHRHQWSYKACPVPSNVHGFFFNVC